MDADGTDAERDEGGWSVEIVDDVIVWEFPEEMDQSEFGEGAWETYVDLVSTHDVSGMVTCVSMDEPFRRETFGIWQRSGELAVEHGIERWAVVATGIKSLSLKGQLDVPALEVLSTEDRAEAIEWAGDSGRY